MLCLTCPPTPPQQENGMSETGKEHVWPEEDT